MTIRINGEELKGLEGSGTIELIQENVIIGCNCNGGSHSEENGDICITITSEDISIEVIDYEGGVKSSAYMSINDLLSEMNKTIVAIEHKGEINRVKNLFKSL